MLCITKNSIKHQSIAHKQLDDQTVLFQAIQFNISHLFTRSLNVKVHSLKVKKFYLMTLSGATTPSQSGSGSNGYKIVPSIPQSSCITFRYILQLHPEFVQWTAIFCLCIFGLKEQTRKNGWNFRNKLFLFANKDTEILLEWMLEFFERFWTLNAFNSVSISFQEWYNLFLLDLKKG